MLKIIRINNQIKVESLYSSSLPQRAKQLSGRWSPAERVWVFPIEAEPQVKELYLDVYGEWDQETETVTLICKCTNGTYTYNQALDLDGRIIASASGRDSGAKTAQGVIVLEGGFTSGGSIKNWTTKCKENTVFKVVNVPILKAQSLCASTEWCDEIKIENESENLKEQLIAEKNRLLDRIAEIEEQLINL